MLRQTKMSNTHGLNGNIETITSQQTWWNHKISIRQTINWHKAFLWAKSFQMWSTLDAQDIWGVSEKAKLLSFERSKYNYNCFFFAWMKAVSLLTFKTTIKWQWLALSLCRKFIEMWEAGKSTIQINVGSPQLCCPQNPHTLTHHSYHVWN